MLFASSFNCLSGAGVITVSTGDISLYTLPSLTGLEDLNTSKVYFPDMAGEPRAWCCSVDGQLLLRTSSNEIVRYACLANMPGPVGPSEIYRIELASRIHTDAKQASAKSAVVSKPKNFAGILNSVKDAASAATGAVMQEFERVRDPPGKPLPSIQQVFQKEVSLLEDDIDSITDDDDDFSPTPGAKMALSESSAKKSSMSQSNLRSPGDTNTPNTSTSVSSRRNQLLGSLPGRERKPKATQAATSRPPRGMPRRTASEIKRVYGHTKAQDARATMERNKELLAERGRKLANLEAQTAEMENDAEDFASMAQELEKAFADRKWWQL